MLLKKMLSSSKHKYKAASNQLILKDLELDFSNQIADRSSSVHTAFVRKWDVDSTHSSKTPTLER